MTKPRASKKRTPIAVPKEQFNVRLDPALREKLDAWLDELNENRRAPLKRSEMVRGILDWAAEHKPDWEQK